MVLAEEGIFSGPSSILMESPMRNAAGRQGAQIPAERFGDPLTAAVGRQAAPAEGRRTAAGQQAAPAEDRRTAAARQAALTEGPQRAAGQQPPAKGPVKAAAGLRNTQEKERKRTAGPLREGRPLQNQVALSALQEGATVPGAEDTADLRLTDNSEDWRLSSLSVSDRSSWPTMSLLFVS